MTTPATCVLSGTVLSGVTPVPNAEVRARTIAPALVGGNGMAVNDLRTVTDVNGAWSLTLAQGLACQVDIPAISVSVDVTIPATTTAAFSGLTLYARGTLTPATILSDHGPSMGGDLTGSSPSPSVVGLRGKPLSATAPTDGQAYVWDVASGTFKPVSVPTGTAVSSVTAGTGITVTGTTTPTVALSAVTQATLANVTPATAVIATINASGEATKIQPGQIASVTESQVTNLVSDLAGKSAVGHTHVQSDVSGLVSALSDKQATAQKGAANGYAGLDSGGQVPLAQLPATMAPGIHASRHATGGADPVSPASIGAATAGHVHPNQQGFFVVTAYGAVGNGVADDTSACQAAIAACLAAGGGTVFFPSGVYAVSTLLVIGNQVELRGTTGTYIKGTSNSAWVINVDTGNHNAVRDLWVLSTGAQSAAYGGVRLNAQVDSYVENVWVGYTAQAPSIGILVANSSICYVNRCIVSDCLTVGVRLSQTGVVTMDSVFVSNAPLGYDVDGCDGLNAVSCQTAACTSLGWVFRKTGAGDNKNALLFGCIGDYSADSNWYITNLTRGVFSGCWAATQASTAVNVYAAGFSVSTAASQLLRFVGCIATNNNGAGFLVTDANSIEFIGCEVNSNNQGNAGMSGITLAGTTSNVVIADCQCNDGGTPKRQLHGIYVSNNVTGVSARGNNVTGNTSTGILDDAAASLDRRYAGNIGYNPLAVTAPAVPASPVSLGNTTGVDCTVYLSGGTISVLAVNGVTVPATATVVSFPAGATLTMTYSVAPTWAWVGN